MFFGLLPFRRRADPAPADGEGGAGPTAGPAGPNAVEGQNDAESTAELHDGLDGGLGTEPTATNGFGSEPLFSEMSPAFAGEGPEEEVKPKPSLVTVDMRLDSWVSQSGNSTKGKQPSEDGALKEFHLFASLPYDLRRRIWRTAMERHRIVNITHLGPKVERSVNHLGRNTSGVSWLTLNRSPALLATCQESRHEALSFYRIHLPYSPPDDDGPDDKSSGTPPNNPGGAPQTAPAVGFLLSTSLPVHGGPVYINPVWDFVIYHVNNYAMTFPIDALLCSDLLAYDPMGVGVMHFGRKGSWRRSDGTFEKPASPLYPLEVTTPLEDSLRNLRSWTELYSLHPAGELQDGGGYRFPHWSKREGYFELDRDPTTKSAYVLPANAEGYEAVLVGLREMIEGILPQEARERAVVGTMHVVPTVRSPFSVGRSSGREPDEARVFVGQYGKVENMFI